MKDQYTYSGRHAQWKYEFNVFPSGIAGEWKWAAKLSEGKSFRFLDRGEPVKADSIDDAIEKVHSLLRFRIDTF